MSEVIGVTDATKVSAARPDISDTDDLYNPLLRRITIYFSQPEPTGTLKLSYITEGAANVIWKVHFDDSNLTPHDSLLVLRMRKNLPSTITMLELKSQFEDRIAPLFLFNPSLLLPVDLVLLTPQVAEELNAQLRSLEETDKRRVSSRGVYHPSFEAEPYGMLMPNLGHGQGKVIEFKPKWLVQSPSAPGNAQRCRTCALNGMRRIKGGSGRGDSGFCPFDLLSSNQTILSGALSQIWTDDSTLADFVDVFRIKVQPTLRQLQQIQRQHGTVGLNDFENPDDKDFSIAMALRDCSLVLKVASSADGSGLSIPTMKLLDLDLKDTGGGKLAKWARMESELIEEGWYTDQQAPDIQCAMAFQ